MQKPPILKVDALSKHFVLHTQGGVRIPVLDRVSFEVAAGECLVLDGPSGAGKSTLLRCLFANYLPVSGSVQVLDAHGQHVDLAGATPQTILELRRTRVSYVSQFLRVIPRVAALDIVAEPLQALGVTQAEARERAAALLARLNLPERLWHLPPATFSGGEQQRVNIARGFIADKPLLLLDEPTASLDATNRQVVINLIREACARGTAVVGIFHDAEVRDAVATRRLTVAPALAVAA
ncbi:phosphonate C-P lyase system protein PhnL [Uliginosibacterium sp. H1]|uniref:phosphonate C-P lyase system protein PhnL n=1 Tax=Uliginosibacterium sp. H1 TaxID=3114757 RepID=UPI002E1849D2|nr:phosphonate C-P lyase system protein PhnL [Uliginosibacterium sp. H1]